jgi:class 3 adenylate cyclase
MCVGFVDLVGSTALARRFSMRELGSASDEAAACTIALNLAALFAAHPIVPTVRAGVAGGNVLLRDGDVFGPVVNLAARAVRVAAAGEVVAPKAVAVAGIHAEALGRQRPKGFDDDVELCRLLAP